jgi:multiple antibiotic resistance protein
MGLIWIDFLYLFGQAAISLFVIMDPVGAVAFFTALTSKLSSEEQFKVAKRTTLITAMLLFAFTFAGYYILMYLDITLSHFQVAGGIFLLAFALRDSIVGSPLGVRTEDALQSISVFPLATPLLAGPGSITTVMLISRMDYGFILAFMAILLNCALALLFFKFSGTLSRTIGRSGLTVIAKLMDIIMGAIGVAYISIGLRSIILAL